LLFERKDGGKGKERACRDKSMVHYIQAKLYVWFILLLIKGFFLLEISTQSQRTGTADIPTIVPGAEHTMESSSK